eukprot:1159416-Pelagomonas_calceolata.AAC.9
MLHVKVEVCLITDSAKQAQRGCLLKKYASHMTFALIDHRSWLYYGLGASMGLAAGSVDAVVRYWSHLTFDAMEWAGGAHPERG